MNILVTHRDGTTERFNADHINRSIERACEGLPNKISKVVQIASETHLMLYDGITTQELDEATINAAIQNVKEDPDYDKVATRLLLKTVYKRMFGDMDSHDEIAVAHKAKFPAYIKDGIADRILDKRMGTKFNLTKLAEALKLERDEVFMYAGISGLLGRYALRNKSQEPIESPQYFFMRIAMGLSYNEKDPTANAIRFYDKMSQLKYIAGGSTNIGAGTTVPSLSNCFLLEIHDNIEHIAKSVGDVIKISKATGGIGASLTKLRASGSPLSSNNTVSSGPTPFAKIIDTAIRAIVRGGKKKGALCFYMENWHIDFPDFVEWKHNAGDDYQRMRTANTAVFISDEFMNRVARGDDWYMFDPKEVPDLNELYGKAFSKRYNEYVAMAQAGKMRVFKKVPAQEQFRQVLVSLQTTSHPWLTWKDPINLRALNNNTGTIHMSNLCTEICLPQDIDNIAVCNLSSLNVPGHIENGKVNWTELEETVRTAVRQLDNLVDINEVPIPEAEHSDRMNRAIGLGVMGLADAFEKLHFAYDSEEAYDFSDKLFEFISYMAIDESANLAQERGSYANFKGSGWSQGMVPFDTIARLEADRGSKLTVTKKKFNKLDWDKLRKKVKKGMRNATLMAVAPNANIGLLAGTTPGIDPRFAQVFTRQKISGQYLDINHNLVNELKALNLWEDVREELIEQHGDLQHIEAIPEDIKARYKGSFNTSPYAFLEVAARAQKWVDQALSRNMYLAEREIDKTMDIYTFGWEKGVKTTYYLHMKPQHSAEQSTVVVNKSKKIGKVGFGALRMNKPAAPSSRPAAEPLGVDTMRPAMQAMKTDSDVVKACPIDPQLRLQCDSCQ